MYFYFTFKLFLFGFHFLKYIPIKKVDLIFTLLIKFIFLSNLSIKTKITFLLPNFTFLSVYFAE